MTPKLFKRGSIALHYRDAGKGLPVLFQHGLGDDETQVAEVFPQVPGIRRITLECRGQGGSAAGRIADFSIATFADDVAALAARLGVGAAVAGGLSMGAAIGLRLAVKRPELVRALVLARPAWVAGAAPINLWSYGLVGDLLSHCAPDEALRRFEESSVAHELARQAPDNLASLRGFFAKSEPATSAALLRAIAGDGPGVTEAEIGAIGVPTLVIGHGVDVAHPLDIARRLATLIPGAQLVEITPKAVDRPSYVRDMRAALAAFLRRLT